MLCCWNVDNKTDTLPGRHTHKALITVSNMHGETQWEQNWEKSRKDEWEHVKRKGAVLRKDPCMQSAELNSKQMIGSFCSIFQRSSHNQLLFCSTLFTDIIFQAERNIWTVYKRIQNVNPALGLFDSNSKFIWSRRIQINKAFNVKNIPILSKKLTEYINNLLSSLCKQ